MKDKNISKIKKKTIVVHSGGMDSTLCLLLAIEKYGAKHVLSMSFKYGQRHSIELEKAQKICNDLNIDHIVIPIDFLHTITESSLLNHELSIKKSSDLNPPNSIVVGRNGLMARIAAIHCSEVEAKSIYMGVMELEEANSGYRDCSRSYIDIIQAALRVDLGDPNFTVYTPLVFMTKLETMKLGYRMGKLKYLLENTISCYEGVEEFGCNRCPACELRNSAIKEFLKNLSEKDGDFSFSYIDKFLKK